MCTLYFRTEEVYCIFGRNSAPVAPGKGDAIGHAHQDNHEDGHDGEDQDVDGVGDGNGVEAARLVLEQDLFLVPEHRDGRKGCQVDGKGHDDQTDPDPPDEAVLVEQVVREGHPAFDGQQAEDPDLQTQQAMDQVGGSLNKGKYALS